MLGIILWAIRLGQRIRRRLRRRTRSQGTGDTATLFLIEMGMQRWR